jgi:glycosyltransferase involved in cell wall biosynthesis
MFIFVQPMYSKQELNADSNYVVYTQWIRAMHKVRPDWHFVVVFPDAKSGFKYSNDRFFSLPNVTRVSQRISPRKMANAVTFDGIWYDRLFRKFGFDAVWCNLVEIAGNIRFSGQGTFEEAGRPLMLSSHNYVMHKTLPYFVNDALLNPMLAQLQGAICSDYNIFNSDHCLSMFRDNMKEWLSESAQERLEKSIIKINYGTLEDGWHKRKENDSVCRIAYNHRLQAYKQYKITFEQLNVLWKEGLRFEVLYLNNTSEMTSRLLKYPFVKIQLCKDRKEYIDALATCDLNVINSVHETFCISAIESMAFGQPLVAPNGITFPEITGKKHNGYPYLFNTEKEQLEMLRKLITDKDERNKWGEVVKNHTRTNYSSKLWVEQYAEVLEGAMKQRTISCKQGLYDQAKELLSQNKNVTTNSFFNIVQRGIRVDGRHPIGSQSFPLSKIIKLVRHIGGEVKMMNGEQVVGIYDD